MFGDYKWICRRIVEDAQDAIVYADREGIIRLWNSGARNIFGYSGEEAVGRNLDLIIPERLRQRHREGYERVMRTGETIYGKRLLAVPAQHRDGTRISIEFSLVLLKSPEGEVIGSAALIRDVTAKWQKEKEASRADKREQATAG